MASGGEGKQVVGMATIVQCPKCSARLKLPPSFKSGVCPRCHASLSGASAPAVPAVPPKSQHGSSIPPAAKWPVSVVPSGVTATQSVKKLGFVAYFRQHFVATHWPAALGICCGLLSIPVVSLLKPLLGFRGMCFVLAGAAVLSAVSGVVYTIQRLTAFLCGERSVPIRARSWTARLTYGGWMFLIPMALWIGAEYFAPPYGLLAAIAPDLRKEQSRWLRLPMSDAEHQESGTTASGNKKVQKPQGTQMSPQPRAESENPLDVVKDAPATKETPKAKTPPTSNKSEDDDPFQVIKE